MTEDDRKTRELAPEILRMTAEEFERTCPEVRASIFRSAAFIFFRPEGARRR
jgi:hypothetical protein